jgi:PAS domain S-box-containing protein
MQEDTFAILTSRTVEGLVNTVHEAARKVLGIEHTTLGVLSPSGAQFLIAASTDPSLRDGQILMVSHVREFQRMMHARTSVLLSGAGERGLDDLRHLGSSYPQANLLVPAVVDGRILGVLMWKFRRAGKDAAFEMPEELGHVASCTAHALARINALESLTVDNARWYDRYADLLDELERYGLYSDLFRYNPDGMLIMNHEGRILLANPAAESVLCPEGDPLPNTVQELLDEEGAETFGDLLEGFVQGIFPRGLDLSLAGNRRIAVSISLVPREQEAILLTLRDVTEQRRIERQLQETTAFMEKIIGNSIDAIIASDMKGRIVLFNDTASRMWGIPVDEALSGMHVNELYDEGQAREIMRKLRSDDYGGVGRMTPQRVWLMSRTGENIPVMLSAYLIYDDGRETYTIGVFSDLREKIRAEEKLAFIEEKLALSEKQMELAELAGAMAHELNQPLTSIYGSTEILVKKLTDSPTEARYASIIQEEAARMGELIKKIGRVTRFETQSYVGNAKITDLGEEEDEGGR